MGYRYSIKNCLYEGVLQKIISECSCLPSFVELNRKNLPICTGEKLGCAAGWLDYLGSSKDPELTVAKSRLALSKFKYCKPTLEVQQLSGLRRCLCERRCKKTKKSSGSPPGLGNL